MNTINNPNIMDQNIKTIEESRKWILQSFDTLKLAQTDLYDVIQALNQLVVEHKLAYDNMCNDKLSESQQLDAYQDAIKIRADMNDILDKWFEKYNMLSF